MSKSPAQKISEDKARKPPPANRKRPWNCTIIERRQKLNLTIRDVAEACGITNAAVSVIEHGGDPQLSTATKLSKFFGVPIEYLWPSRRTPN